MDANDESGLKESLLGRIKANRNGKVSVKLKTLVGDFRDGPISRVHQSSLEAVLKTLADWGITYTFPAGTSANDYITLSTNDPASPQASPQLPADAPNSATIQGAVRLRPGEEYRVLSVRPPWAWAIIFAGKNIENRGWTTPYRGAILIHASSKKFVGANLDEAREYIARCSGLNERAIPKTFPRSQMLGLVDLVDCIQRSRSPWADPDDQHWLLENPRPLKMPIRSKGKLNLWKWTYVGKP
jgi:hypothetical protein